MDISSSYTMADCARYKAERDALAQRMDEIASEIDRTISGVEGIEDAPALRWMRGLREALGALHSPRTSYEDIDAAKWVREHGGLDEVKRHYFAACALSGDLAEWKREVYELCEYIGVSHEDCDGEAEMLQEAYKVLGKRLMPEGMGWPRYEDGEPVLAGNVLLDANGETFRAVSFLFTCDWWSIEGYQGPGFCTISKDTRRELSGMPYSERVKRPAPKVLDADGAEICEGDTVYGFAGQQYEVTGLCEWEPSIVHAKTVGDGVAADELIAMSGQLNSAQLDASKLTHSAPVIAGDGRPLRDGETVYEAGTGDEFLVRQIYGGTTEPDFPDHTVRCSKPGDCVTHMFRPDQLTHERPDSWERWREEWQWPPCRYCKLVLGVEYDHDTQLQDAFDAQGEDLERRAKALAGVSER